MPPEALAICTAIPGWMYPAELAWLYDQAAAAQTIVEVGVWQGRSTAALCFGAQAFAARTALAPAVFAVDHFQGSPGERAHAAAATPAGSAALQLAARRNLSPWIELGLCWLVPAGSVFAARQLEPLFAHRPIDLLVLDGDHSEEGLTQDLTAWLPLVRPGGRVCGHDYGKSRFPGVTAAVDRCLGKVERGPGSLWSWVKP